MGIVKISDLMHENLRVAGTALSRSINAQAEHWMRIGMLAELHPDLDHRELCQLLVRAEMAGGLDLCSRVCGDGKRVLSVGACDDGNIASGDGCSEDCAVEPGYVCCGGSLTRPQPVFPLPCEPLSPCHVPDTCPSGPPGPSRASPPERRG